MINKKLKTSRYCFLRHKRFERLKEKVTCRVKTLWCLCYVQKHLCVKTEKIRCMEKVRLFLSTIILFLSTRKLLGTECLANCTIAAMTT